MLSYTVLTVLSWLQTTSAECYLGNLTEASYVQCGKGGYAMRCNGTGLTDVPSSYPCVYAPFEPPLCLLDLSNNSIRIINNNTFVKVKNVRWLDLSKNKLHFIDSDSFNKLSQLLYLNLTVNNLSWNASFGQGVFKPLVNLNNLNIKENNITTFVGMGAEMATMRELNGLFINACPGCMFGQGFERLTRLVNISLSGLSKLSCTMANVQNLTFAHVPQIKRLWMSNCHILTMEANALSPLKELELLDMSYNEHLTFKGMNTALYGLRNSSTLSHLNVNQIHFQFDLGTELKLKDIENLSTLRNLTVLHMDLNKLELLDQRILKPYQLSKTLQVFTLAGNRLTYGKYVNNIRNMAGLKEIDLSRQHLNFDPFKHLHDDPSASGNSVYAGESVSVFECNCNKPTNPLCLMLYLPEDLQYIKFKQSFLNFEIYRSKICGPKNLEFIDLSFNMITKWNGPVYGLESVKHMDLSENYCQEMKNEFFRHFTSLEYLKISGNFLGLSLHPSRGSYDNDKMFSNLHNLKLLDMSYNKITQLRHDVFTGLTSLRYLNLSGNNINMWTAAMDSLRCIKEVNLSSNRLNILPAGFIHHLDSLEGEHCNRLDDIKVDLSANPIECSCHTLPMLKTMHMSMVQFIFSLNDECQLPEGEKYPLVANIAMGHIITLLENECNNRGWVITLEMSLASCITSVVICVCLYKYRWKLRYIYYKRNRRHAHEGFECIFDNDAFVAYPENLAFFIKDTLVSTLELRHHLKVWVADRNSTPGASIAENIAHAIYSSRKSIFLINRKYLKEKWADYEINMATIESVETKRKMIIIVLMEDIPTKELPLCILQLLRNETSLEYPIHPQDNDTFWANLVDAMNSE